MENGDCGEYASKNYMGVDQLPFKVNDSIDYEWHDHDKFPTGPWCKIGDWIIFARYAGSRLAIEGGEVRLLNDDEVLGTIDNPESVLHNI